MGIFGNFFNKKDKENKTEHKKCPKCGGRIVPFEGDFATGEKCIECGHMPTQQETE